MSRSGTGRTPAEHRPGRRPGPPSHEPAPRQDRPTEAPAAPANPPAGSRWQLLAVVVLLLAAALAGLSYVWNFDVHWHLASGQWMLRNGQVLGTDIFSVPEPGNPERRWINVHWLFQVLAAGLHTLGGWHALSMLKAAMAAAALLGLALSLRKAVPPAWLIFCGLLMLLAMIDRVRVRPEAFTLAFLIWTVALVESVRRGGPVSRLWWLAPVQVLWVNMHALYVLGIGIAWSAWLGALVDSRMGRGELAGNLVGRKALLPIAVATAACLVSPWPLEAPIQPFLLYSNISGQAEYLRYGVSEFMPAYDDLLGQPEALGLALLTFVAALANVRRLPLSHAAWIVVFTLLGLQARRNVAMVGPVFGYLLAWHGGELLRQLGSAWPRLVRVGPWASAAMVAAALAVSAAHATEWIYKAKKRVMHFGTGRLEDNYPLGVARFLEDCPAKGEILCTNFGDAAVFMYHSGPRSHPRRLVYLDGRLGLGVHGLERFIEVQDIISDLRTPELAARVKLPPIVRFLVVSHEHVERLTAITASPRFRLIRLDPTAACFARMDWSDEPWQDLPARPNLGDFDRPLTPQGQIESMPAERRLWYRQNPIPRSHRMGKMLLALGQEASPYLRAWQSPVKQRCSLLAARYLTAALNEGLVDRRYVLGYLAQAHQQRSLQENITVGTAVPIDLNLSRCLHLYELLAKEDLSDPGMPTFTLQHVRALLQARQLDAAERAAAFARDHFPAVDRVRPPAEHLHLQGIIAVELDRARAQAEQFQSLAPTARVQALTSPGIGLMDQAVELLRSSPHGDAQVRLALGDLLLRKGLPGQARRQYEGLSLPPEQAWQAAMRLALCDWVEGRFYPAVEALELLAGRTDQPVVRYYCAAAMEHLGLYQRALAALGKARGDDEQLTRLIDALTDRLRSF